MVGFDLGPLQGRMRLLLLQYFFKYVLPYFLHLNNCLVTFLHNTICREQLFLSFSSVSFGISFEYAGQLPFTVFLYSTFPDNYAFLSLSPSQIKKLSQLTECPLTGTLVLFDPGATTSSLAVEKTGPCLDQATGEAVDEMQTATQPFGAPGAGIATQPVQAPGSFPEVQPTGEGDMSAASDSEADQLSDTGSLDDETHRDRSADRDVSRDDPDSEPTEEANYRETMRGVRSFMNWHKVPEFETVSSTADDNPFAGARVQPTGKVSVKLPVDDWLCRKMSSRNLTITEGYPTRNTDNTGLLRDQFIKTPRSCRWYGMHAEKSSVSSTCTHLVTGPCQTQPFLQQGCTKKPSYCPALPGPQSRSTQALGESSM